MRKSALTMHRRKSNRKIHDTHRKSCFDFVNFHIGCISQSASKECHIKSVLMYKLNRDWSMRIFYHPPNDPFPPFVRFHSLRLLPISPTTPSTALPLAFPALPNARDTD
jgi:hypothetical protein